MYKFTYHAAEVTVPAWLQDTVRASCKVTMRTADIPRKIKMPLTTALRRGYTTALSGIPVYYYHVLSRVFDFPVFCVGRTDRCVISLPNSTPQEEQSRLITDIQTMWKLSRPDDHHTGWFRCYTSPGHSPHWMQLVVTRPQAMTIDTLVHMMGADRIDALVPLENRYRALSAVEQGEELDVSAATSWSDK